VIAIVSGVLGSHLFCANPFGHISDELFDAVGA
jgi:hypothetical protein